MSKGSNLVVLICMILGLLVLCALGTWQVQRLVWKEALIERVEARLASEPRSLTEVAKGGFEKQSHEYLPVRFNGKFDHSREVYFFTTGKGGAPGWNVHTPVWVEGLGYLVVNRGFVPFDLKLPESRREGQVSGSQELTALLRFPLLEKPFGSLENDIKAREFYWRSVPEMSEAMKLDIITMLPVIADLRPNNLPGGWPRGGSTILSFPNNHLQYAVTWFGLALTLLGVGGYFLYSRSQAFHDR